MNIEFDVTAIEVTEFGIGRDIGETQVYSYV